jgi:hypothetical protein
MWWTLGSSVVVALGFVVLWYWTFTRWNRRRAQKLLVDIETAFAGNGHVGTVRWLSSSHFLVQMKLGNCGFTQPTVTVKLLPREMPLSWIASAIRKHRETLTFDANLLCPPGFNLEVQNQRWSGKSRRLIRRRLPKKSSVVRLKHLGPFILTSRRDWQKDITGMVHALSASRDCDLLSVSFRRTAPHFSATIPLESIARQDCAPVTFFDALRELASGASAARF